MTVIDNDVKVIDTKYDLKASKILVYFMMNSVRSFVKSVRLSIRLSVLRKSKVQIYINSN
jgi:hypothetical protein